MFLDMCLDGERDKCYFFKRFKMKLHDVTVSWDSKTNTFLRLLHIMVNSCVVVVIEGLMLDSFKY